MKITFLGVSGALSPGHNSNILIDSDKGETLLFDAGITLKQSLEDANRDVSEIDSIFISHLHSDHCGSLEWLGYYSYFILKKRITLYIHESMVSDLWSMLRPGMERLQDNELMTIEDYFNTAVFKDNQPCCVGSFYFVPVRQIHVETPYGNMYSYGMVVGNSTHITGERYRAKPSDDKRIFISSDSKCIHIPYTDDMMESEYDYDYIFCDCDVMNLDGVHANYNDLKRLDKDIKKRIWLYHYTDLNKYDGKFGEMPNALADGFAGFVKQGQIFEF